jgi:RNA polymerase sigma-70 factor (ECF subfamily)
MKNEMTGRGVSWLTRLRDDASRASRGTVDQVRQLRLHAPLPEGLGWVDLLVERARSGDLAAFEQLAERSMPEVYRLAVAIVGPDDGRDVAQEALVAAWRELPSLRRPERFDSWLRSIVMNRARNALRSRRRHPTVGLIESHTTSLIDESLSGLHRRIDLEAAFGGITTEQREVLILHYLIDLPLREVASVLGVREGTAKSRLHAGLKALRARMPER